MLRFCLLFISQKQTLPFIFSIAALWKFDSATSEFTNKKGYALAGKFDKPGAKGLIKAKNGEKVLGFVGTENNPEIKLEEKITTENDKNQMWKFSQIDNHPETDGYFTIESVSTKMLLHGNSKGEAFLGSEFFHLKYDYDTEDASKLITSRKSIRVGKKIT